MNPKHEKAFVDPGMQKAARLLVDGNPSAAIEAARQATGVDSVGPEDDTLLTIAIGVNDRNAVRALLSAGANPNIPQAQSPIAAAAEMADPNIVSDLLRAGADSNGRVGSETALWRAAVRSNFEIAEMLLQHGAKVDVANVDGDTPALAATQANKFRMALFLLERGASPIAKSNDGTTMAEWAAEARMHPKSDEGQARERLYAVLRKAGAM